MSCVTLVSIGSIQSYLFRSNRLIENAGASECVRQALEYWKGDGLGCRVLFVAPDKAALVETELLKEADLLRAEGLTAEELSRAKAKIVGQRKIARQDLGGFAMANALDELYGLGYAYTDGEDARYEAVTLDQIKAAAQKYLKPDALVVSIVQPDTDQG